MAKYYEVAVPRNGKDGKTFWHRIGTAFPAKDQKDGGEINVELDALPLTDKEGRCSFIIRLPREKNNQQSQAQTNAPLNNQLNDDIPWLA